MVALRRASRSHESSPRAAVGRVGGRGGVRRATYCREEMYDMHARRQHADILAISLLHALLSLYHRRVIRPAFLTFRFHVAMPGYLSLLFVTVGALYRIGISDRSEIVSEIESETKNVPISDTIGNRIGNKSVPIPDRNAFLVAGRGCHSTVPSTPVVPCFRLGISFIIVSELELSV